MHSGLAALATALVALVPAVVQADASAVLAAPAQNAAPTDSEAPGLDQLRGRLYQGMQSWVERFDTWFADSSQAPLPVPPSSLRLGLEGALFSSPTGASIVGRTDTEGTIRLPNLERRLRLFITSVDVQESPADPSRQPNPLRLGMRLTPGSQTAFDIGVRTSLHPSAFATLKWSPRWESAWLTAIPFAKAYAESNLGAGISAGIALQRLQAQWMVRSSSYNNWQRSFAGVSSTRWSETVLTGRVEATVPEQQYGSIADGRDIACGLLLRLYAAGDNDSSASVYESSIAYKRHLTGGWLFGYAEPAVRWERSDYWHPDVGIRIGIDAFFISGRGVRCR